MSLYNDPEEIAAHLLKKIKRLEDAHAFIVTNASLIAEQEGEYDIVCNEHSERVEFDLREGEFTEQLRAARIFMRKLFGTWKDEFNSTWNPYGDTVIVSWKSEGNPYGLWMRCTLETFPKSLYPSEKCSWMVNREYETKALVCEV